ncbi:MAG: MBL fold metallo-hydrolase [Sphingopyxis sp.]
MIATIARRTLGVLVWICILILLAIAIAPRFLDRIYYQGANSSHFDGAHFFNPDSGDSAAPPSGGSRIGFIRRMVTGEGRAPWPDHVAITQGYPHPALNPCPSMSGGAHIENWNRCTRDPVAADAMAATWIGHASVLIQTRGFAMLTDPIWASRAGPFGIGPQRVTQPGIRLNDLPKIDLIVVSHNHYDHLNIETLKALWARDHPMIVTALGNDALLRAHGIGAIGMDWGTHTRVGPATVHAARNHHWSSRWGVDRNRALWSSFVVDTPAGRIVFAGDTGFGDGLWAGEAAAIPLADGSVPPVRFAMLPIGAFRFAPGQMHIDSHIGPAQAVQLWNRLGRPQTLPIHWGTFRLSNEARETPPTMLDLIMRCAGAEPARFAAWRIGEARLIAPAAPTPPINEARVAACEASAAVRALP